MSDQNKLREILHKAMLWENNGVPPKVPFVSATKEAEQAILEWVNEVIGANTPLRSTDEVAAWKHAQNQLRAEQRRKAGL